MRPDNYLGPFGGIICGVDQQITHRLLEQVEIHHEQGKPLFQEDIHLVRGQFLFLALDGYVHYLVQVVPFPFKGEVPAFSLDISRMLPITQFSISVEERSSFVDLPWLLHRR